MGRGRLLLLVALVPAAAAMVPGEASAQPGRVRLELHGGIDWRANAGVGVRVDIPILPDGFLSGTPDELALSPGGEIYFGRIGKKDADPSAWPLLALQWNIWPSPRWSLFPEVGIAFEMDFGDDVTPHPLAAFGVRYHFSSQVAMVFRGGYPMGGQFGIVITF